VYLVEDKLSEVCSHRKYCWRNEVGNVGDEYYFVSVWSDKK